MRTALVAAAKKARGWALAGANAPDILSHRYKGTDKIDHGYLPYYRSQLGGLRLRRMTVFEIGVGGDERSEAGGSLQLWRDYFARSMIIGIDIHPKVISFGPHVKFEQADQNSAADLSRVVEKHGRPTIVIDDGSHIGEHILASFTYLWPQVAPGGVYVIEDLATSYDPEYGGSVPAPPRSAIGLLQMLASDTRVADPVHTHAYLVHSPVPDAKFTDVAEVHVFPGIGFVHKAR